MLKKKISSINFKTLCYLILFSVSILLILIISQNIFLDISYEKYQLKKMKNISNIILENKDVDLSNLEKIAYENSVCIQYVYNTNESIPYNTLMVGCELNKNNSQVNKLMRQIMNSNQTISNIELKSINNAKALLSGIKMDNGYVFVYSVLEDLDGASLILKGQLIYITLFAIIISCIISYFLSRKITEPITKITKKAKDVGEGKYDIVFERSEIKEIDELAQALNHMESDLSKIDELRRDLMANVSHDLKTPLTMIQAYAEMIRDISYKDKEKMDKDLNVIIEETQRLNILVNDILELSKMQAEVGDANLTIEKFDLVSLINEVINRYKILEATEDYEFILELPKKVEIEADKKKMTQVIYNLINNAINYTGDDKKVYIKVIENKKDYTIEITDTGSGIKKEEVPYIWDKYYKKDKNHQRNVVSTGLGLSIVKEILVQHKFDYGVKSILKKGTTFYFRVKK